MYDYIYIYIYLNKTFLVETMISYIWLWIIWLWIDFDTQPMGVIHWYSDTQTNGGYSLVFWYPNQWGLFQINGGYLLVLWYPANGDYSLVFWYPNQKGLFIGTLIPKPMGVIHWYSDAQSRGYSVTIVIRLLRIWITFEHLNYFESLKFTYVILKMFEYIWTTLSH